VFDPFVTVDPESVVHARWDATLDAASREVLERLCALMPYLGRAESLCAARVLSDTEVQAMPQDDWYEPGHVGDLTHPTMQLLSPQVPLDVPALVATTTAVRKAGRTTPPGTRWLSYPAPVPATPPPFRPPRRRTPDVHAVRLRFASSVRHETVAYGHVLRAAVIRRLGDHGGPDEPVRSPVLGGKDNGGRPRTGHRHAHYLALTAGGDARLLNSAVVWSRDPLTAADLRALSTVTRLTSGEPGFRPVRVAVEQVGSIDDVLPELVGPATRWRSITPFAPYRHRGKRQPAEQFLEGEVARELHERGLPAPKSAVRIPGDWSRFRSGRTRRDERLRLFGLELQFADLVEGPLALGALSHFGLGTFRPILLRGTPTTGE
jgi:CRISPR-associated protein Csb2